MSLVMSGSQVGLATSETRYSVSAEMVITDKKTGLEWLIGPKDINEYSRAEDWVNGCKIANGGWRLPTRAELRSLFTKGLNKCNMDPLFRGDEKYGTWVWADPRDEVFAWFFRFDVGEESWRHRVYNNYQHGFQVFGVRLLSQVKVDGSNIEGKVSDDNNKPVVGLKVIALQIHPGLRIIDGQVQPIKGFEQFETISRSDGSFMLKGLYPSSTYVISLWSPIWVTEIKLQELAAPQGETLILSQPFNIKQAFARDSGSLVIDLATGRTRYRVSPEGVITDNNTGLEWVVGPDKDATYKHAENWIKGCKIADGGWRLPTRAELRDLYAKGLGRTNIDPVFKTTESGSSVWAEPKDGLTAWYFNFYIGFENSFYRDGSGLRIFGVRSPSRR